MAAIRSFRDLEVYRQSVREAKKLFVITKAFPREEMYSLTDQVRRSSCAVGSMIAEAWAKRRYQAAFIAKLVDALGEATETQSWLDHSITCDYIDKDQYRTVDAAWQSIGGRLAKMIDRADEFCRRVSS